MKCRTLQEMLDPKKAMKKNKKSKKIVGQQNIRSKTLIGPEKFRSEILRVHKNVKPKNVLVQN